MGDTMKLALQLTAVDMMSGMLSRVERHIRALGPAGKSVARDFELMSDHAAKGLRSLALATYGTKKILAGIKPAADLQESIINVRMNLMEAGKDAKTLDAELAKVRSSAVDISKIAPFSAQDVVEIENTFLKAGLKLKDVVADGGAAWAASALATITKEAPGTIADAMVTMASPFNIQGGQFKEMADYLQKVDMASVTSVPELMEGAKYVSGKAAEMKVNWKDMLRAQGVIAQQGLRGSMGGTSLNDFLGRLAAGSRIAQKSLDGLNASLKKQHRSPLEFWDKQGRLKALPAIIKNLRESLNGLSDKKKEKFLEKFFGEQGARAAVALAHEGAGSWEDVGESIDKSADIAAKMDERLKGFNANVTALGGTTKTTMATFFDPMLDKLTEVVKKMNEVVFLAGKLAEDHPDLTKGANIAGAGAVGAAGVYAAYNFVKAGIAGGRVLKGLSSLGGAAIGIAEGKAIEAATGVTPVFVVNMPGGGIPSGSATPSVPGAVPVAGSVPLASVAAGTAVVGGSAYGMWDSISLMYKQFTGQKMSDEEQNRALLYAAIPEAISMYEGDRQPLKNEITMNVSIDANNRVTSSTDDANTKANVNVRRRGVFDNPDYF